MRTLHVGTLYFTYLDDYEEVPCYGFQTLLIDRNHSPIDLPLLDYIDEALREAASRGEKAINVVLNRIPTDYAADLREHLARKATEENANVCS